MERVVLEDAETLVPVAKDVLGVKQIVKLDVRGVVERVAVEHAVPTAVTIVVPDVVVAVVDVPGFAPVAIVRVVIAVPAVAVVVDTMVVPTAVTVVPVVAGPIVLVNVVLDVKVTVEPIINVKAPVHLLVLVPPAQECFLQYI